MNVHDIVVEYLKNNGYDGLYSPDGECGCLLDDLAPCNCEHDECKPGYKIYGKDLGTINGYFHYDDWYIVGDKK